MNTSRLLLPRQWRNRAAMSAVLLAIGIALLGAAHNDHWSATVGLALGQIAIGAGAWVLARPLLTSALAALGQSTARQRRLPPLLLFTYPIGVVVLAGTFTIERALIAAYLTVPGLALDTLLRWYEGQEQRTAAPQTASKEHSDDYHRA